MGKRDNGFNDFIKFDMVTGGMVTGCAPVLMAVIVIGALLVTVAEKLI